MKIQSVVSGLVALALTLSAPLAFAEDKGNYAVGAHGGTLGFGPDISLSLSPRLTLRGTGNFFSYDLDETVEGIDYNLDLDLMTAGALIELHPFQTGFHFALGAFYNDNSAGLDAVAGAGSQIGSFTVPGGQSVGLRGDLDFDEFAPYLGLGWDRTFTSRSNWSVSFQAGVLFQSEPNVGLRQTSGPAVSQSDLNAEARSIEDDLELLEFFPVVSFGLNYRF